MRGRACVDRVVFRSGGARGVAIRATSYLVRLRTQRRRPRAPRRGECGITMRRSGANCHTFIANSRSRLGNLALPQKLRQLREVHRHPPGLVSGEHLGLAGGLLRAMACRRSAPPGSWATTACRGCRKVAHSSARQRPSPRRTRHRRQPAGWQLWQYRVPASARPSRHYRRINAPHKVAQRAVRRNPREP